jgi:hypothetical protein
MALPWHKFSKSLPENQQGPLAKDPWSKKIPTRRVARGERRVLPGSFCAVVKKFLKKKRASLAFFSQTEAIDGVLTALNCFPGGVFVKFFRPFCGFSEESSLKKFSHPPEKGNGKHNLVSLRTSWGEAVK